MRFTGLRIGGFFVLLALLLPACGGRSSLNPGPAGGLVDPVPGFGSQSTADQAWPAALPRDALQPWEQLNASGYVRAAARGASCINGETQFAPGVERVGESATGVSTNGEAARVASGAVGARGLSWAWYRLSLEGEQPGVVSADVNVLPRDDGTPSAYFLGVSDYGRGAWEWRGPFRDHHVRLALPAGDYLSPLGNLYLCVVGYDGARFDIVGLGANPRPTGDATPPPAPAGLSVVAVAGGLELSWNGVIAGDLAGYQIYYSAAAFTTSNGAGVRAVPYLEGGTRHLLCGLSATTFIRVAAVDLGGNQSTLSNLVELAPLPGTAAVLGVSLSAPSGGLQASISLTATGADSYDFDLDGDGVFELTGQAAGDAPVDTSRAGLLRPAVRGSSAGGCVACGGVSLIITGNTRPVASATANPQSGAAPLSVTFTGTAADAEDLPAALTFAWDFDGDGTYEAGTDTLTPAPRNYPTAGLFNAKLRVTDSAGAWDVDTVTVQVLPTPDPANQAPQAALSANPTAGNAPLAVSFNAGGSSDADGSLVEYAWDFDGDGVYDGITDTPTCTHTYTAAGSPTVKVRVTDDDWARDTATVTLTVNVVGNELPVAALSATPSSGDCPLAVTLNAGGSSDPDGSLVKYEWDFDGDGAYDAYGDGSSISHTYTSAGSFTAQVRVTDDVGAQDLASAAIAVNAPPVAALTATPPDCNKGESIVFSAADSSDCDGSIAQFEWDLDGNGSFETNTGTNPLVQRGYTTAGELVVSVRVTDNDGAQATAGLPLTVHGWQIITVDGTGLVGMWSSLAVVDGCPAISYFYDNTDDLKYARATTPTGAAAADWTQIVTVDTTGMAGYHTSLAVVDGCPAISYCDYNTTDLKYARAVTSTGGSAADWTQLVTIDSTDSVGLYNSLAVVDGCPAISYSNETTDELRYARATTSSGGSASDWTQLIAVDSAGNVGWCTSLAVVDGCPAIAYRDNDNNSLKYARATTASGGSATDWSQICTVYNANAVYYPSLAVVDGCPAISFLDNTNSDLRYIRSCTSTGGSAAHWTQSMTVDTAGNIGTYSSLAVVNGHPAISYIDTTNVNLKFAHATSSTGGDPADWTQVVTADNSGTISNMSSLAEVDGHAAISYYDMVYDDLKYAILF